MKNNILNRKIFRLTPKKASNCSRTLNSNADPRITRTKMTVTELQKQKKELEAHVSDLVKKAELKQAELARVKMEVRRLKEEKCENLDKLLTENETLRRRLNDNDSLSKDVTACRQCTGEKLNFGITFWLIFG